MLADEHLIKAPRRLVARGLIRFLGRLILPIFFRLNIQGVENFPERGPVIVVGNHSAAMEVVLLAVYTPWQVEILGGSDVPHEKITELASRLYGYIPYKRGYVDRTALKRALSILRQSRMLVIFPEGGIWQTTERRVQPGVAWLSEQGQAPVLPIYFGGTTGALKAALQFERPLLTMTVGELIPAAQRTGDEKKKAFLHAYAMQVMNAVDALSPQNSRTRSQQIKDERYELEIALHDGCGDGVSTPGRLQITHPEALAKLLLYPRILKIFRSNLKLPIDALQALATRPAPQSIAAGCTAILDYLDRENPYLLTYRFGPKEAEAMQQGLKELGMLAEWAGENRIRLEIKPSRRFSLQGEDEEIVQTEQGVFENWM